MNNQFYSASEAQSRLGLSKAMFHRKVKQGLIPKVTAPGMKQGVYPKRDIDALAQSMNAVSEQTDELVFSRSSPADQVEEMEIGIRFYGHEFIVPLAERIAMQQKSEFTFWSLKRQGHVVGHISLFRLTAEMLDDLLTGRKIEREITVKDVLPFVRLEPYSLYTDMLAVDPTLPPDLQQYYTDIIMSRTIDVIFDLRAHDYLIEAWYATVNTAEREALAQKNGFRLMQGKSIAPARKAYECVLNEENLKHLWSLSSKGDHAPLQALPSIRLQ
jgi:hypothetical protein